MSGKSNYFQTEFTISVTKKNGERDVVLLTHDDDDPSCSDDDVIPVSFTSEQVSLKHEERNSPLHVEDPLAGPPSMASSSASIRRLEWDSGADVGYVDPDGSIKKENLSAVERLALGAAVLTRSEPEGTNIDDPPPAASFCGLPEATSTPMAPSDRPLSPEIIVRNFGGVSDSDFDDNQIGIVDQTPRVLNVKSSSLDNAPRKALQLSTSTYPRCSNVPPPLPAQNAPSTSSSSSVTVVKRQPDSVNAPRVDDEPSENDSPQSSGLAGDRANSFEYLPGGIYEGDPKNGDTQFQNDLDRGVELLAEFLKNVNIDSEKRKRRLIKNVVECLLAKNYPGDSDLNASDEPRQGELFDAASSVPKGNSGSSTTYSSKHEDSSKTTSHDKDTTPSQHEEQCKPPEIKRLSPEVLRYVRSEKQKQLNWIRTEINHLQNLKALLEKHETLKRSFNLFKKQKVRDYREKLRKRSQENEEKARTERKKDGKLRPSPDPDFSESTWNSHSHKIGGQLKRNASTNTTIRGCPTATTTSSCPPPPPPPPPAQSVAYTITFDRPNRSWLPHNDVDQIFIAERDQLIVSSREHVRTVHAPPLQAELLTKKPQVIAKAEFRRRAVAELAALRELRVENKGRILTAALNGEPVDPILTNPLKYRRAVSNTSMKRLTEKHYKKATEVQTRRQEMRKKEEKQTNRLMAQIFNTKLQKKVLRGETDLPHTVNVITS